MEAVIILATIGISIATIVGVSLYFKTRHRERLALIKYDKEASIFIKSKHPKRTTLKWALLSMGAGAGILLGTIIDSLFRSAPGGVFSAILICGGAALFVYYSIVMRDFKEPDDKDELV